MKKEDTEILEKIQRLIVKVLATNPQGNNLCLVGGFRFRLLDNSPRASVDVGYHWAGDLSKKQGELVLLFKRKLLPEAKHQLGYDGTVGPKTGPDADSPLVKIVDLAFYRQDVPRSRIEIPVDITRIECFDKPVARSTNGIVYLTVSDKDMIESKVITLFNRNVIEERDMLDIFLYEDKLAPDSAARVSKKLRIGSLNTSAVSGRLKSIMSARDYHIRNIAQIIDDQLDPQAADRIRNGGGAHIVFDHVLEILQDKLKLPTGDEP